MLEKTNRLIDFFNQMVYKEFMKKSIAAVLITISTLLRAADYNHPGTGNFIEAGVLHSKAVYGYEVLTGYGIVKFDYERFQIEGFRTNYNIIQNNLIKLGPMVQYNFKPYNDSDIKHLNGMKRSGFFHLGILAQISIPVGQLFFEYVQTTHNNSGSLFKTSFATALPLLPLNGNHIWLNLQLEYGQISRETSTYLFGVKSEESKIDRPSYSLNKLNFFSSIFGLWTPVHNHFWINFTYLINLYPPKIKESPIIRRKIDSTLMLGIMFSF